MSARESRGGDGRRIGVRNRGGRHRYDRMRYHWNLPPAYITYDSYYGGYGRYAAYLMGYPHYQSYRSIEQQHFDPLANLPPVF